MSIRNFILHKYRVSITAKQVSIKKPSVKTAQRHEFYDILELLNEGTFVRDFSFAKSSTKTTQPRSFQATSFQLEQLSRICASHKYGSVLGFDATFNCGNFYVTLNIVQTQDVYY